MAGVIVYERFAWFHGRVKAGRFPNARHLAERFEISRRTAKRHIEFMRDRLGAPIDYDAARRGYLYIDESFDLPRLPVTQEEVLAVLVARRLLSHAAGGFISEAMRRFGRKLLSQAPDFGWNEAQLEEAFSASWHGYSPVPAPVFQSASCALLERRLLQFTYRSPVSKSPTRRTVEPHHLQHYMGTWVLIARCRLKKRWRKFSLARMTDLTVLSETFTPRPRRHWQPLLEGAFGIFQGEPVIPITLRFNSFRSPWIREQLWHPEQILSDTPDSGVELTFPVADFREVRMMILQFGADVEVVAPDALRREVAAEIEKMAATYETRRKRPPVR